MSKQRQPTLDRDLEPAALTDLEDADLDCVEIEGTALAKQSSHRVRFTSVRVVRADLSETKVAVLRWLDVECVRSQLSLVEWPEAKLARVVFRDSRATGARMEGAELEDVRFVGCQLDYAAFPGAKFSRVTFERCRLRNADFGASDLSGTMFLECDLHGVTFLGANLAKVDICTCSGSDVRIEAKDVRGLIVNSQQAAALARLFGLVVRDPSSAAAPVPDMDTGAR
jgi:uncharacterized protein YjbI with pentapeptide repeats